MKKFVNDGQNAYISLIKLEMSHLSNKFHFSEVPGSMNAMVPVQSIKMTPERHHVNFAWDPLRSYFDEPQKKMELFFYIYVFYKRSTNYFRAFCVKFANYAAKKMLLTDAFGHYVQQPSS